MSVTARYEFRPRRPILGPDRDRRIRPSDPVAKLAPRAPGLPGFQAPFPPFNIYVTRRTFKLFFVISTHYFSSKFIRINTGNFFQISSRWVSIKLSFEPKTTSVGYKLIDSWSRFPVVVKLNDGWTPWRFVMNSKRIVFSVIRGKFEKIYIRRQINYIFTITII